MKNILSKAKSLLSEIDFEEIALSSFIHGEEFLKECRAIKDFSERVYWSPVFIKSDCHVVKPTIEAQICSLLSENHREIALPLKVYTIRDVGRYETGKTFPVWKERSVWPFFELFSVHRDRKALVSTIEQEIKFVKDFFQEIGLPVLIVTRPKIIKRLQEYSEERIEAVSITPYNRIVVLANIYDLGDVFSKVYGLKQKNGHYLQMSTLGFSGRVLISAVSFLANRDGLLIPPQISPYETEIILVQDKSTVTKYTKKIAQDLKNKSIRFFFQKEIAGSFGDRKRKALKKGIPLLIFIGEKETATNTVLLNNRLLDREEKVSRYSLAERIKEMQVKTKNKYDKITKSRLQSMIIEGKTLSQTINMINNDYLVISPYCIDETCLIVGKEKTGAEIIGSPIDNKRKLVGKQCIICGKKAHQNIILGKKWRGEK